MIKKTKIAILGIGGVGGYFGGLLADKYFNSKNVEVIFITRPSSEKIIKEKGLKIITDQSESIVFPALVTSDPDKLGHLDYLICSVKSYDLEESLKPLANCINNQTVILPLLNGVDSKERIAAIFPAAEIWEGCAYIVSRLIEPGVIKKNGTIHSLHFGSPAASKEKLLQLESLLKNANIECNLSDNIEQTIWEKFLFISSIASLTSYLNLPIGDILKNEAHKEMLIKLLEELKSIAVIKKIKLSDNIMDITLKKIESLPYETTSSMHNDFIKGRRTEYVSLTEYSVKLGDRLVIETPAFDHILSGLQTKIGNV